MRHWVTTRIGVGTVVLLMVAAAPLCAQNWRLQPAYGTVELSAGFSPDPHVTAIQAGGSVLLDESTEVDVYAYGWVAEAPDLDLRYTAGSYVLTIRVEAGATDTVLLINAPDGSWHFNDDCDGTDPAIRFDPPQSGLYDIWVGTFSRNATGKTRLVISEMPWSCR